MAEARKRKCYDFKFKQAVIKHAEETNNREAARKYSVDESMVRRWRKIITSDSSAALNETPIWADMPSATTVDMKGSKVVPIKTTGHEKQSITACLAVKADGTKIKPFVVLHGLKVRPKVAAINGAVVKCSENGWMNDKLTAQ